MRHAGKAQDRRGCRGRAALECNRIYELKYQVELCGTGCLWVTYERLEQYVGKLTRTVLMGCWGSAMCPGYQTRTALPDKIRSEFGQINGLKSFALRYLLPEVSDDLLFGD